jgi:small acid-soluble spore protein H (minor)
MNNQRAREISESSVMANVTYNNVPIYIQHVDEQNNTARIYPLDQPENEQEVSLNELREELR